MRFTLLFLLLFIGCAGDPELRFEPDREQIISIAELKRLYRGYPLEIQEEIYIDGRVIALLERSIVIEDASGGIEIRAQIANAAGRYGRGMRLMVHCNTLTLSDYGDAEQLGWGVEPIPEERLGSHLHVVGEAIDIIPYVLSFPEGLSKRRVNCWVRVEGVRIAREEMGGTWGESDRAVDRHIVDNQADTLIVRIDATSPLADMPIPSGSGAMEGVLGYFNGRYQLRPISGAHILLDP